MHILYDVALALPNTVSSSSSRSSNDSVVPYRGDKALSKELGVLGDLMLQQRRKAGDGRLELAVEFEKKLQI